MACEMVLSKDEWKVCCGYRQNTTIPCQRCRRLRVGRFMPLQNWVDLLIPSARDVPGGTLLGTVGFACENGSMGTNSASWCSLSCDQETAPLWGANKYKHSALPEVI